MDKPVHQKSTSQLVQQIRFGIECLLERNGHHEFENACRQFARLRISLNILPSTGPVSAGGDQGRDFETFRTFICGLGGHKFAAIGEGRRLAFACSLTAESRIARKIEEDVESIMAGTLKPELIYFFAGVAVVVAEKHKLQAWAKTTYGVELEIIDAPGLAEQLSAPDVFWIAVEYLRVSPEVFPQTILDDDYTSAKKKWLQEFPPSPNFADFIEVKTAARKALADYPEDLPRWIERLVRFEGCFSKSAFWHKPTYEVIALTVRLTRSLVGQEERIRKYMARDIQTLLPDEVEDLLTIAAYALTSLHMGSVGLDENEIISWLRAINARINDGVANPASPNQKCYWLKERARSWFHLAISERKIIDLENVYSPWLELSKTVADAPVFPIHEFHDDVLEILSILGEHDIFDRILEELRPIMSERVGRTAVAESHFERARQLVEREEYVRALNELHSAKVDWFTNDTLGQSVLCCLILAKCYKRLGLHYAALYHGLIASFVAANSNKDWLFKRTPEGLFEATDAAYAQGHTCLAWELLGVALELRAKLATNPLSFSEDDGFKTFFQNIPLILTVGQKVSRTHYDRMLIDLEQWRLRSTAESLIDSAKDVTSKWTDEDFQKITRKAFAGPPFSDAGEHCICMWAAHGLRFCAQWKNDYQTHLFAAELIALFQTALADIAGCDLDIIPGTVQLDVKVVENGEWSMHQLPSNEVHHWEVIIPTSQTNAIQGLNEIIATMLGVFYQLLRGVSVMPDDEFDRGFKENWAPKSYRNAFFARRYSEVMKFLLPKIRYGAISRDAPDRRLDDTDPWQPKEVKGLHWVGGLHPRFNEAEEKKRVRKRYQVCAAGLRYTLPRLKAESEFRQLISKFRADGWKDWHILSSILNVVAAARVAEEMGTNEPSAEWRKRFHAAIFAPETKDSVPVPLSKITPESVKMTMIGSMQSTMVGNGLHPSSGTPNIVGERRYMAERWRYFDLDVPHKRLLDEETDDEKS